LARLGRRRALVLSTPEQSERAAEVMDDLGPLGVGTFTGATMHTPTKVSDVAAARAVELGADCVVAVGGGSTIGLGKAVALRTDLDQIVLPTTYAGSEVTPILGETVDGRKTTQRNLKVLPETVIYDVDLTLSLPVGLTVTSATNSMAHAVEAIWAKEGNPITSLMAAEAINAIIDCLPRIVADPIDREARSQAQYGAWLGGTCLATVGMALHHKLCHVLGGTFDLPHAETHAVVLPYVVAYNAASSPEAVAVLEEAVGKPAAAALQKLAASLGAPTSLRELGMPESGIDTVVQRCTESAYFNPRPTDPDSLRALVEAAWAGAEPAADGYR
jgi:maleylacetate reductase